ncbi:PREDICTED: piggyBac transposable element-derived protein 4-like isoform X2 [Dinoponera quadriceps]|uniref:PiggyBac transposable element-derived protein 4-like isoform X2 n=1 Tax=Dinoponera quadriceps TaxID=609295 RepID=A0A6P3XZU1_DINQU|nr:PREDICTED: piggyBac transposable element-derived protein 4-like isoform X2 [Dinoponera quadriceps]
MVAYCIICKIGGGEEDDVSFHRLPRDEKTRANWFAFIGYKTGPYTEICSKHFQESDFIYKVHGDGVRRFLKPGIYPTISRPLQSNKENIETFASENANDCASTIHDDITSTIDANIKLEDEKPIKIENVIMDEAVPIVNIPLNRSTIHDDTTSDIIPNANIKLEDEKSVKIENVIIDEEAPMVNTSLNRSTIDDDTISDIILNTNVKLEDKEFIKFENVIIDEEVPMVNTPLNRMFTGNKKSNRFKNELTDSEYDENFENENNFNLRKRRRTNVMHSSSESETELIEGSNDTNCDITWTKKIFVPKIHQFTSENSGIAKQICRSSKIIDYFQLFISEELVEIIVNETNYHWARQNNNNVNTLETTALNELYCFFAMSLLMTRNKNLSLKEYWSTDNFLRNDIFRTIMTRDRYFLLLRMIHFLHKPGRIGDRLTKIINIIDMLRKSFNAAFQPYQKLCIDDSLFLYKDRLSFKQYIPSERNRFGLKSFILCDCKTGYVQDIIVYAGSSTIPDSEIKEIGKSGAIVLALLKPYLGKGHTLYVDSFYSSPALFNLLYSKCTNACGTVRKRRRGMPRIDDQLKKGEVSFRSSKNLLALKWIDKEEVYIISTMHTADFTTISRYGGKQILQKPVCVADYSNSMGIGDKVDMVISTVDSTRKSLKWYRDFFFHLIDICVWNAYCLYKHKNNETISMAKFQLQLIKEIIDKYHHDYIKNQRRDTDNPMRLTERHFPSLYTSMPRGKNRSRRCVVCSKHDKRSESRYECKDCNVGLCIDPCFRIYHTQLHY